MKSAPLVLFTIAISFVSASWFSLFNCCRHGKKSELSRHAEILFEEQAPTCEADESKFVKEDNAFSVESSSDSNQILPPTPKSDLSLPHLPAKEHFINSIFQQAFEWDSLKVEPFANIKLSAPCDAGREDSGFCEQPRDSEDEDVLITMLRSDRGRKLCKTIVSLYRPAAVGMILTTMEILKPSQKLIDCILEVLDLGKAFIPEALLCARGFLDAGCDSSDADRWSHLAGLVDPEIFNDSVEAIINNDFSTIMDGSALYLYAKRIQKAFVAFCRHGAWLPAKTLAESLPSLNITQGYIEALAHGQTEMVDLLYTSFPSRCPQSRVLVEGLADYLFGVCNHRGIDSPRDLYQVLKLPIDADAPNGKYRGALLGSWWILQYDAAIKMALWHQVFPSLPSEISEVIATEAFGDGFGTLPGSLKATRTRRHDATEHQ